MHEQTFLDLFQLVCDLRLPILKHYTLYHNKVTYILLLSLAEVVKWKKSLTRSAPKSSEIDLAESKRLLQI